jgi:acylphosphatase
LSEICRVEKSLRLLVSGRVQKVGYREACRQEATALGLVGWVRNLSDGRVELQACGDATALEKLRVWCSKGPWLARVSNMQEVQAEEPCTDSTFRVLR